MVRPCEMFGFDRASSIAGTHQESSQEGDLTYTPCELPETKPEA